MGLCYHVCLRGAVCVLLSMTVQNAWASQVALVVKNLLAYAGDFKRRGSIPGSRRSLEGLAAHSSILAWRIPWTEENGRLQAIGLHRLGTLLKRLSMHACAECTSLIICAVVTPELSS